MNTPAHLLIGAAIFGRPAHTPIVLGAFAGALLPDLSLYLMAGAALFVMAIPPSRVFNELYYSDEWQTVFAIDNSFLLWGLLLGLALWRQAPWAIALASAALLHLALDFPLHHDDGRPHFWPASAWVYESPISYWDRAHGAFWVAPFEAGLALISAVVLWLRRVPLWAAVLTAILVLAEFWIVRKWLFFFIDS
ncbi:cobalamin biosynthesis protein CobQ [uncultured Tateyamaria sp.]|uniref:cobalamin biosynthesis protein CobQ n=1 Tax=uncultured Tateyamaria sp. TaxID=455651 RepID=UPI0026025E60|nr:cobalamin biosynthesis protein CobQ [uncultured Tateyamaria sp.]